MSSRSQITPLLIGALLCLTSGAGAQSKEQAPAQVPAALNLPAVNPEAGLSPRRNEIEQKWKAQDRKGAHRAVEKWMKDDPRSPEPWVAAASLRYREGRFKKSLKAAKAALDRSPQAAEAYYWKGRSFEAMNKPLDAANEYRAALHAPARYEQAQEALNRVLVLLHSSDGSASGNGAADR